MERFDLLGPLPAPGSMTVLEASAGTGKTFALAGLVTRYVAEGVATLAEMLLITFSRSATRELRDRVRQQISDTAAHLDDPASGDANELVAYLRRGSAAERDERRARLRDALAQFDDATIATTHEFCSIVLKSLGVAGDSDTGSTLVEDLGELVVEVVDDLYLAGFGTRHDDASLPYADALKLAKAVVADPCAELRPRDPDPDSAAAVRLGFAAGVRVEFDVRKRRLGILSYDDLLERLAVALRAQESGSSDAAARMRRRWPIVLVDEFQDTDPVQWEIVERAFGGHSTVVLIGDPKQAIYGFRGGDIYTYLDAAGTAGQRRTLDTNWRSDAALVDRLQVVLGHAALGHEDIVVHDVQPRLHGHRLAGAPRNAPFRLRVVGRDAFNVAPRKTIAIDALRKFIPDDLAADIGALLASGANFDDRPVRAGDVAVIVEKGADARPCQEALTRAGIPAVYTGDANVFAGREAKDWLLLLDALDQTQRSGVVRAAATTVFFGNTADDLAAGGDELTDTVAATLREWAGHLRERGPAALLEAAQLAGMARRVLAEQGGARRMTDLAHITELLQRVSRQQQLTLPALREWLRDQATEGDESRERNRRIDSDAAAVQIMTVWGAKGLQFPIVYLPFAFNRNIRKAEIPLFHEDRVRCLHVGGEKGADWVRAQDRGKTEAAGNDIRLAYVALTRAQSQVVAWWAPARDEPTGGLSRLMRGRRPGESGVPDRCDTTTMTDEDALELFRSWEAAGGPVVEEAVLAEPPTVPRVAFPAGLAARHFHRAIDTTWRRTSYSALIRGAEDPGVASEPESTARDDEVDVAPPEISRPVGAEVPSPMAGLPSGAAFGSLVHAVLETADPLAPDLAAELAARVREHAAWWPVQASPGALAAALVAMHDTGLGPLAPGVTLRQIGLRDRLRELAFEIPLAGGDAAFLSPEVRLADVGDLLVRHLPAGDPLAAYGSRLRSAGLGDQPLRGYLSGSIDAVLRLTGERYLVVDYKTNLLGDYASDYSADRLAGAMLHSDYPLQALLYLVVLHRFLRWRQPGYDPAHHLGGVLYLFVRGMCGAETPATDGNPCGVFSWHPPADLTIALSDLLDEGKRAA